VLATFIDITREEEMAREDYEKKLETIDLAQRVIHKQMMVAQEIAGLLGETTAETKTTLTKLCQSLLDDGSDGVFAGGEEDREIPDAHLGSGAVPLQGVMTAETQQEQKKTGYVRLSSADIKKPGGIGGR
jgi:hypothetical protein